MLAVGMEWRPEPRPKGRRLIPFPREERTKSATPNWAKAHKATPKRAKALPTRSWGVNSSHALSGAGSR